MVLNLIFLSFLMLFSESCGHLLFYKPVNKTVTNNSLVQESVNNTSTYDYFDWRSHGVVTPIKDQKECPACWAFSVIASIESHMAIHLREKVILSEQFLIDCDESGGGCANGSTLKAFSNIVSVFLGVLQDRDYPYVNYKQSCRWDPKTTTPLPVVGYRRVPRNEGVMALYILKQGPLVAAINSASMDKYKGGIDEPTPESCDPDFQNHSVLIVGYNVYISPTTGKRLPYWIIKNSWGVDWGEEGFYYLVRGRNACGITSDVSFPYVD